ncbi:DUF6702 family protein [Dyadobacter sediminis]|uniref:Uncharacterized protein n=1 Tax=Dyadobacter sediminis TaxID=1493691 RepID=A0A5R9K6X0_9BACT|nr:DUF6702 family protein [Dyadobacter sediminis]TLU89522.1 hypothetical protein FEM55_22550 [Dyadobacter sediminis]GGC04662.1 hypothetical protein GCM10011325_34490 [Dyadobacter sediminis]
MIFLAFSSIILLTSLVHDYHVSVTQMQYNPAVKAFEVSIRIFTDDLEKGLTLENNNKRIVIRNDDKNDPLVEKYILKSFLITDSSKKPLAIKYIGKEQEEDATWVYLEIPFHSSLSGYKLQNSTLMEVFDDQVNMTNLKLASEKKTFLFKKGQTVHAL